MFKATLHENYILNYICIGENVNRQKTSQFCVIQTKFLQKQQTKQYNKMVWRCFLCLLGVSQPAFDLIGVLHGKGWGWLCWSMSPFFLLPTLQRTSKRFLNYLSSISKSSGTKKPWKIVMRRCSKKFTRACLCPEWIYFYITHGLKRVVRRLPDFDLTLECKVNQRAHK